jgi:pimeloyl-ACP methyl ester carboxylesterase
MNSIQKQPETVVLVHGLWMVGIDMWLLRYRLQRCGFATRVFSYATVRRSPAENARKLQRFLAKIDSETVHFVTHSLGGLVIRHLFHEFPEQKPGRIVTLAPPHQGSAVARRLSRSSWGRLILGKSLQSGLLGDVPAWRAPHELGVIAGNVQLGMGRFAGGLTRPNDGTVEVSETALDGMTEQVILPATHISLLFSRQSARQVCAFLKTGHFISV